MMVMVYGLLGVVGLWLLIVLIVTLFKAHWPDNWRL